MVKTPDQLEHAWNYAKSSGRVDTGKVIVEAKIDFDFEITLLTVRALNESGQVQTYFCEPIGHVQENGDYRESWQPQAMTPTAIKSAQGIAAKITDEIGGLGLFGVELFFGTDVRVAGTKFSFGGCGLVTFGLSAGVLSTGVNSSLGGLTMSLTGFAGFSTG